MALNVISNYAADVAHNNLMINDRLTTESLAKLSSGSRVVSAKDDAASMAIGSRLNAEVQAEKQCQVNATQATSMLQIADGAMSTVSNILVRMKTLAVQAGSGQLGSTERSFLNTEYQSLLSEVDRVAKATTFNGTQLVNGTSTTSTVLNSQSNTINTVQAADGFANIALNSSVGDAAFKVGYDNTTNILTFTNLTTGQSEGVNIGSSAIATNATQTVNFNNLGVTVTLNSAFDKTSAIAPTNTATITSGAINNIQLASVGTASTGLQNLSVDSGSIDATNTAAIVMSIGGFSGSFAGGTGAKSVTLSNGTSNFKISFDVTTAFTSGGATSPITLGDLGSLVFGSSATSNSTSFTYKLGTGNTAGVDDVTVSVNAISASALGISGGDVTTATDANTASTAVSAAIDTLNTARAGVGAAQNRLQFASDNLASSIQNSEAARSNLMDLDVASEMTNFTSKQILVQVGVSMLAQANQLPQNLLKLFH